MVVKLLQILCFLFIFQSISGSNPIYKRYEVEDGLPSSLIYDVVQDDLGLIWIATDKGLSRFDGKRFVNFTVKDGLPHNDIFGLIKDKKGRIWLNTLDHVCYIENGRFNILNTDEELGLHQHYFGKFGEHFLLSKNSKNSYLFDADDALVNLSKDGFNYLYYTDESNYSYYSLTYHELSGEYPKLVSSINSNISVKELDKNNHGGKFFGSRWFGKKHMWTYPKGLDILDEKRFVSYTLEQLGFKQKIKESYFTREGVYLKNSQKVVFVSKEGVINKGYNLFNDLDFNKIFLDNEGNYWLSSNDGLYFISNLSIDSESVYFDQQRKLTKQKAVKIIKDVDGSILVATFQGNIYKYVDGNLELMIETGLEGFRDMVQDGYGKLWIATDQLGCFRLENLDLVNNAQYSYTLKGSPPKRTKSLNAIFKATVKSLKMGPDNRLYIASAEGVSQIEFADDYFLINKLDSTRSYSVTQDLFGFVWIGRTSGISRFKDDHLIDMGPNHPLNNLSITDLEIDQNNGLWIGSDGYGLFHDRESLLCTIDDLDGYIIKSLLISNNVVWAATNKGVVSVTPAPNFPNECKYELKHYSSSHGLASDEVNDILIDDGYIYAATKNGVSKIPIQSYQDETTSPLDKYRSPLIVQSVEVDNVPQIIQPSYDLSHDQNNIRIDFAALSYQSLGRVIYEYQMTNIDTTWLTTSEGFKEYQALRPGEYTFRLRAKDVQGETLGNSQFLKFDISKPWWNQWWFILANIILLLVLMFLYTQYRISKTKEKAQNAAATNQKFAELEMQAIRSQMNPHFLFNALHSIQDYIFNNDSREANRYISSFANLMRKILDASKEKYIYLYQELDMLNLYLELEKLRFNEKFTYSIKIDPTIDKNTCEIPTMIIQPFVENAINHGLMHRPESGELNIWIGKITDGIKICIDDNGIGINNAQELKETFKLDHESKGMKMIYNRLELMNEMYDARIKLTIAELNPADTTYPGTIITLELPNLE